MDGKYEDDDAAWTPQEDSESGLIYYTTMRLLESPHGLNHHRLLPFTFKYNNPSKYRSTVTCIALEKIRVKNL